MNQTLIDRAERKARNAKRAAEHARAATTAAPEALGLRHAAEDATEAARTAGRELAVVRFEEACERWVDRAQAARQGSPFADPTLLALAEGDVYLGAALHLRRDGTAVPAGWRSPNGETL